MFVDAHGFRSTVRRPRKVAAVALILVGLIAVGVSGCSSDDDAARSSRKSTTSTATVGSSNGSGSTTVGVDPSQSTVPGTSVGPTQASGTTLPPSKERACAGLKDVVALNGQLNAAVADTKANWRQQVIVIGNIEEPLVNAFDAAAVGAPEIATPLGTVRDFTSEVITTIRNAGSSKDALKQVSMLRSRDAAEKAAQQVSAYASANCGMDFTVA